MTCIAIGAMMAEPAAAQQKDNYPELEGPGPVIIISKDKNGKQELIDDLTKHNVRIFMTLVLRVSCSLTGRVNLLSVLAVI